MPSLWSFDHYPFEIRYCGISSFVLLTQDDFCYLKCFMVPKTLCCCCSVTKLCPALCNPWTAARQAFLSFTLPREFTDESVVPSNHLMLCHPRLLPSIFPASGYCPMSQLLTSSGQSIGVLASFPSNEYSGLISFRIDWFDLLDVQGTIKSLLQHHSWLPLLFCNISLKCFCVLISQDSFVYSGLLWIFKVFCGSITNFRIVLFLW